ncbi:C4-dicarboxylate ABC transporter substrate-binding protein [Desulfuromonas versatilis]|uniref:C4-dicarboxylate ABC transporter substrate-binding protein n=1 Tax=Desulfuromonas versatilis TaxID=2802975 RepID=A0ABM8I160_9BACT|nr:TAXI family TRAP transporter solute-binding subunit [Desulfuromonas versatilis]BCR06673.1 C4-dicarboxylate ABC transporter substrate-binding protein [Desulfuromonas versatilis]
MLKSLASKLLTLALAATLLVAAQTPVQAAKSLIIATATTGGTYYPVGVAIGTLISVKLASSDGITATAINSAGSGENVQMLKNNECDLAILQGLYGAEAYHGKGSYAGDPMQKMAGITMLWQNVEHFALLSKYAKTGTAADLKGLNEKFSIGKRGSGTEGSGRVILGALGIEPDKDFTTEYLGYNPSVDAMQDGRIAGGNIPAGVPVSAITQMYAMLGDKGTVLDFTDEQLAAINGDVELWTRFVIPPDTYPGQKKPINTIAQPNLLVASSELDEETVYKITKTIYENLPFLNNIHGATKAMALEKAIGGMPMPLHPGAVKYYQEAGVKIPEKLLPKK